MRHRFFPVPQVTIAAWMCLSLWGCGGGQNVPPSDGFEEGESPAWDTLELVFPEDETTATDTRNPDEGVVADEGTWEEESPDSNTEDPGWDVFEDPGDSGWDAPPGA